MNAKERLDYLLESVFVPTNATITVSEIVAAVGGMDAARLVVGTLQAGAAQDPILASSYQALSTVGMSLSGADRQGLIDQLAANQKMPWPDEVRDAVKALGGVWVPRWQVEGLQAEPTLESIEKQLLIDATRTAVNSRTTAINGWLDTIDISLSIEEIEAFIADILSSDDGNPTRGGE
jgi:hypothetical protein